MADIADTPERSSQRMYREAKETLEQREKSHILQLQKQAADIDAECTFIPSFVTTQAYHNNDGNNEGDDSRFDRLYQEGSKLRKEMDKKAIYQKKLLEKTLVEACSFSPKVNTHTSTSSNLRPTPPEKGSPSKEHAIAASSRLYQQAISRQQRVKDRETRRIRLEGDQCTFHPEITDLGYDSKGTKYRYGPLMALQPGVQSTGERLYGAGLHARKKKDKMHTEEGSMKEHFTFKPEISPRSKRITNTKSFDQRLYENAQRKLQRQKDAESKKQNLLTFKPTTNVKWKSKYYHASVSVMVPQNNFGLPDNVSSKVSAKASSKASSKVTSSKTKSIGTDTIKWYCKRKPVPRSPKAHALRMYTSGLKKLQVRDQKFYHKNENKDWSSCTFMPQINKPNKSLQSPPRPSFNELNEEAFSTQTSAEQEIVAIQTTDVGCQVGTSTGTARGAAVKIQRIGRGKSERILFARKRSSSIQIQKIARGRKNRKTYQNQQKKKKRR